MGKIDIKGLDLYYGSFHALKNVNLSIPEREDVYKRQVLKRLEADAARITPAIDALIAVLGPPDNPIRMFFFISPPCFLVEYRAKVYRGFSDSMICWI